MGDWRAAVVGGEPGLVGLFRFEEGSGASTCDTLTPSLCLSIVNAEPAIWSQVDAPVGAKGVPIAGVWARILPARVDTDRRRRAPGVLARERLSSASLDRRSGMRTTRLDAPFGVRLHLDTSAPLTPDEIASFRRAFAEHGLLVIRDGPLPDARQIELMAALGRVEPDESGAPMRMEVTNQHDETSAPDGELVFHYDYAYDPAPIPAISLYGALVEGDVTPTRFVSSSTVLDRLPAATVRRLRALSAAHACFLRSPEDPHRRSVEPDPLIERGRPGWGPEHYWHHHPAIFANAWGVETLFVCLQHTDRFDGLARRASDELLAEIFDVLYAPSAIYEHAWRAGDLVVWDNLTVQHARPEPSSRPRTLRRYHVSETNLTADYLRIARERGFV